MLVQIGETKHTLEQSKLKKCQQKCTFGYHDHKFVQQLQQVCLSRTFSSSILSRVVEWLQLKATPHHIRADVFIVGGCGWHCGRIHLSRYTRNSNVPILISY